ncbi:MAG: SDR family NAD(P)-dependent oxidoreductase [Candidatus Aminicenantia bacterium]
MKKVALVTGASKGLGKEIAVALSEKYIVGIHYFKGLERALEVLQIIKEKGGEGELIQGDLSSKEGVEKFAIDLRRMLGNPDILVNNFGPIILKNLLENTSEDWLYMFQTNLITPFVLMKEFIPTMREKGWGRIINIGFSESSKIKAFREIVPYAISKNALFILTRSIAKMEKGTGITCNLISPFILEEGISPNGGVAFARTSFGEVISIINFLCQERNLITGKNFVLRKSKH